MKKALYGCGLTLAVTLAIFAAVAGAPAPDPAAVGADMISQQMLHEWHVGDGVGLALIVNAANLATIYRAFNTAFNEAFEGVSPEWGKVATPVPSATGQNDYGWLGDLKGFRKWVGDRHIHRLRTHDYSIKNEPFEMTEGVPRTAIEDDQYGVYTPLFRHMGQESARHPDVLVFELLKDAFTTAAYDGQNFIDTDHPVGDGTVSNHGGGAGNAWFLLDTSKALKPLIFQRRKDYNFVPMDKEDSDNVFMRNEFLYGVDARVNVGFGFWQMAYGSKDTANETNYAAGREAMMAFKGDHGRPLGVKPDLVVCGPSNEGAFRKILLAERLANGEDNVYRNTAALLVTPYLD